MTIFIAGDAAQQASWPDSDRVEIIRVPDSENFGKADAYIDLAFDGTDQSVKRLQKLKPALIIINSVVPTLKDTDESFVRINAWETFTDGVIEAAGPAQKQAEAESILRHFSKSIHWTADVPGFVTARIISMIINEAFMAEAEEVSSRNEIDMALKLGTAYPYGPFEWAEKIGLRNVEQLLTKLQEENSRYAPAPMLLKKASVQS